MGAASLERNAMITGPRAVPGSQQPLAQRTRREGSSATPKPDAPRAGDGSAARTNQLSLQAAVRLWLLFVFLTVCEIFSSPSIIRAAEISNQTTLIVVVGAPGQPEFGSNFVQQATLWQQA